MAAPISVPPNAVPARGSSVSAESLAQYRSDYERLLHRYVQLTWATSASEQRERAGYQRELLKLYLTLHPDSIYTQFDDFDAVLRASRRG